MWALKVGNGLSEGSSINDVNIEGKCMGRMMVVDDSLRFKWNGDVIEGGGGGLMGIVNVELRDGG